MFPSVLQLPAKLVHLWLPNSRLRAMAPWVRTDTPLEMRRRGSSLQPWGLTVIRAFGKPSMTRPESAGPTANHRCDDVA